MRKPYWIKREHLCGPVEFVCSVCGTAFDEPWPECPECGAKMKKVKYDPVFVDGYEELDILLGDD